MSWKKGNVIFCFRWEFSFGFFFSHVPSTTYGSGSYYAATFAHGFSKKKHEKLIVFSPNGMLLLASIHTSLMVLNAVINFLKRENAESKIKEEEEKKEPSKIIQR